MYYKQRQPGPVKTITADWKSIPWEVAEEIYSEAAGLAEETALVQYRQQTQQKYPDAAINNLQLPNKLAIRRKAGNKALVDNFIPRYKLEHTGIHVIAQIVAHLATLKISTVEGVSIYGELLEDILEPGGGDEFQTQTAVSGLNFLKDHFKTPQMMGLYRFLMLDTRGSYLTKQYTGDARNYCALVPLIMSAFKRYSNIPYSAWNKDEIKWIVNPDLCEAMLYETPESVFSPEKGVLVPYWDNEKLLKLREHGLTWKSGTKQGTLKNPLYTHSLSGMQGTEFSDVPDLTQVMLTQIWCAHPENRTKYMVLSSYSWDRIPPSLISTDIFLPNIKTNINLDDSMPWAT